eukprot:TRINITY_DN1305_c0_g4_i1.p1 TRINITY_DN1305_c0_g4~~TRINITY_DN1305_c0_g4_i1.p1  ORF type:complete len:197 (-),score=3.47 TRINITY_DN1305_c0_g4_i1:609-1199(-)
MAENAACNGTDVGREIKAPRNLTSSVWKFFGFWAERGKILEPRQKVICKVCKVELAYHSTTSNMWAHLSTAHPDDLARVEGGPSAKQPRLDSFLKPTATSSLAAPRQEAITQKLVKFVCKGMRPISVVEDEGFKEFCREMELCPQPWDCHTKDSGPVQPHRRSTEAVDTREKRGSYHGRVDIFNNSIVCHRHGPLD